MSTKKSQPLYYLLFVALLAISLFLPSKAVLAQTLDSPPENAQVLPQAVATRLEEKQVRTLVENALPRWDNNILDVSPSKDWIGNLDFRKIYEIMKDEPVSEDKLPPEAERLGDNEKVVRLNRNKGKLRYISRVRAWNFKEDASTKAVDKEKAREVVLEAIADLGIPREEMTEPRVDTQVAVGAPIESKTPVDQFEMYRTVSIPRRVNQLPVYGSKVSAAVSNEGLIQRLQVAWPAFRLSPDLSLRKQEAVVEEAVKEIMVQDPLSDTKIQAYLAYAPSSDDTKKVRYVPGVIFSVYSSPTPYQFVIPVAETQRPGEDD